MTEKIRNIICIIIIILLLPILFVNVVILAKSFIYPNQIPSFLGYKPFVVLSGSMEVEIYTGDLVVVKEINPLELKQGDVIAYRTNDNYVIVHRIVEIENLNGQVEFKTKGDNNNIEDNGLVDVGQIEGIYLFNIPKLGNIVMLLQKPIGLGIAVSVPIAIIIITQVLSNREYRKELEELRKKTKEK